MKAMKWVCAVLSVLVATPHMATAENWSADVREDLQAVVRDVEVALAKEGLPKDQGVTVLPLVGDQNDYVGGLLKNAVTGAGLRYVEARQDPLWDQIVAEIDWDHFKEDILDASTITKFGKLMGTEMLLYGTVREVSATPRQVFVEIELHLTSVETKQHVWGQVFTKRRLKPVPTESGTELNEDLRTFVKKVVIEEGAKSLQKRMKEGVAIGSVAIVPLPGDSEKYVQSLVESMLTAAGLTPKNLDINTLEEARTMLRDQPQVADAVIYGAVRELSRKLKHPGVRKDAYELVVDIQLSIQSAVGGDILWSETLAGETLVNEVRTDEELALGFWTQHKGKVALLGIGILALIALGMFLKAATRAR